MAREGTRSATGPYLLRPYATAPASRYRSGAFHLLGLCTKSHIGNSRPRVFPTVPETTTTTKKRATANTGAKRGPKKATAAKGGKPAGVTKKAAPKKAAPAKKPSVVSKVNYCRVIF